MCRSVCKWIQICLALAILYGMPAASARAENSAINLPVISGTLIRNDARITFEWPKPVPFTAKAKDNKITITFDRRISPDLGALLSSLYPYIKNAQTLRDEKTLILTMDNAYKIRTFITDNIGGIDLLGVDPAKRAVMEQPGTPGQLTILKPEEMANLAPTEGEPSPVKAATPATNEASTPPVVAPSNAAPAIATASAEHISAKTEGNSPIEAAAEAATEGGDATKVAEEPEHSNNLKINVSAAKDSAVIRLPFSERAAIAVFVRGNYLWIVLDNAYNVDLSDFESLQKTVVVKAESIKADKSVIRVALEDNIYVSVAKEESSFEWAILLTEGKHQPTHPLAVEVNTDPPSPPNVFIKSLQMADVVSITDPLIGDEMLVTPLYTFGEAIAVGREFIEFSILPTAQGIAVIKKEDNILTTELRNGLRISSPQGTILTAGLPPVSSTVTTSTLQNIPTLFPYEKWQLPPDVPERKELQRLFRGIVENTNHREANEQRIRLAQIYIGKGLAAEALGILGGIGRTDPIFYRTSKLAALHGAANFLMYRFSEAARDFSASELNNNKEIEFWRTLLADLLGTPTPYDFLGMNEDYISKYPPLLRQRLAIVAANHSVDEKNYNVSLKIFDTLRGNADSSQAENNKLEPSKTDTSKSETSKTEAGKTENAKEESNKGDLATTIRPYINYLFAKIATETGQATEGVDMWEQLTSDYSNPFIQTHAEFSKIIWDMNHGNLDKEHAIEKLERLRLSWHGDGMELKILELLGNLYSDKKDYVNAMRVWDNGVSSFPSTPIAIEMARKMRSTFTVMFSEEATVNTPPMDALVLYYQYKSYAPSTGANSEITDRLADKLVGIDLLQQAANLLDHEMRSNVSKERRSRVGAKIASIYLMAHDPQKALSVLQDSVYGEVPNSLKALRNRLTSQALFEMGELDRAKQIIARDEGVDAERIRLGIYWQQKDWPNVITTSEGILKIRKDVSAQLSIEESDTVLRLALAYVFQNDPLQLQYLHDYFGPLMTKNPNKPVFDFITASDLTPTPTNFDSVIKRLTDTSAFISNYSAHIQLADIKNDSHVAAPPKPLKQ